jgi:type I restriction enzyme S subunit
MNLLPNNWTYAKINDLISNEGIFVDGDWIESKDQNPKGKVRLIQLADIRDGIFRDKSNRYLTKEKSVELGCTYLKKQDILVARLPEPLGRACIFPLNNSQKYITAVDICVIRPANKYVNIKYLLFLINSPIIRIEIDKLKSGTTRKRISRKNFAKIDFPIAPMHEQNRIVEKIEELFSDLDKATEDLKKSQEQLKIYRQAVLKAAFEGNKTSNWKQMKLGGLIRVKSGNGLTRSQRLSSGIFFVYGGNGILGKYNKYMFEKPKLIIGRVGVNCGNVHITRPRSWVTDNAFIVSYDNEKAYQEYLLYYLEFLNLNKYAGSTAQPVISGHKIYPIDIKLPNKEEQFEIFSKIEKTLSIVNKLKETVEQNLSKIEYLRQSILKKAFEGKLVPQNPNDEPAEKLLERIKQQKEKFESNNKKRKNR